MALLLICDILSLMTALPSLELRTVNLQLVRVEDKIIEAILLLDLGLDRDCALVGEVPAKFDIVDGYVVVQGFRPDIVVSIAFISLPSHWNRDVPVRLWLASAGKVELYLPRRQYVPIRGHGYEATASLTGAKPYPGSGRCWRCRNACTYSSN